MRARLAAARVLVAVERGRGTLGAELDRARDGLDDARDRAFLLELAAGALRWRNELDALIGAASHRDVARLDPQVRAVLRIGLYQVHHLPRVAVHAVVHESVEAVRTLKASSSAGFVNAVLRGSLRRDASATLPPRPAANATDAGGLAYLTTTCSHPEWLVKRWLARYGFDATERWCAFNNAPPDVTIRPLPGTTSNALLEALHGAGVDATPAPFVRSAIRLPPGALGHVPGSLRDTFVVQDEGAQLVAEFAGARLGESILDVCAAPGGKTLVLAQAAAVHTAAKPSIVVAGDRRPNRLALLTTAVRRSGLRVSIVALDASQPLPFRAAFDCVLLDAPCSGLGTLRRDPDLKWSRTEADLSPLAETERAMLGVAAEAVRPGGRLIYATCSSEPDENDRIVDAFLATDRRFSPGRPAAGDAPAALVDAAGRLRTLPFRDGLDAYFAAILVRSAAA